MSASVNDGVRGARVPVVDGDSSCGEPTSAVTEERRLAPAPAEAVDRVDLDVLYRFVNGDPSRLTRFVSLFDETVSQALQEMQAALGRGDLATLAGLGHRLKSSSRMVGAHRLAADCESLEWMTGDDEGSGVRAAALVAQIDAAARRVFVELQRASAAQPSPLAATRA